MSETTHSSTATPTARMSHTNATLVTASQVFSEEITTLTAPSGLEITSVAETQFRAIDDAIFHDPSLVVIDAAIGETLDLADLVSTLTGSLALTCVIVESTRGTPLPPRVVSTPLVSVLRRPLTASAFDAVLATVPVS